MKSVVVDSGFLIGLFDETDPLHARCRAFLKDYRGRFLTNIQHPGEPASERSNPDAPRAVSNWPDHRPDGRPRAATLVIRREDGGPVGT